MSLHAARQDFIGPLFVPTNNAGVDALRKTIGASGISLLPYHGPLASDRQEPHDIKVRVHRKMGSRKKSP